MLAHLPAGREVCLAPASYGLHAAAAEPGVVARKIVPPEIVAEWSILWPARSQSAAITRFLDSARRCAGENEWLPSSDKPTGAATEAPNPARL
jgi:DNA-binding transcriptional LysR family regulator